MAAALVVTAPVALVHGAFSAIVVYGALQSLASVALRAAVAATAVALSLMLALLIVSHPAYFEEAFNKIF